MTRQVVDWGTVCILCGCESLEIRLMAVMYDIYTMSCSNRNVVEFSLERR